MTGSVAERRENPNLPLDKGRKMLLAAEVAIGKVLKKEGDKLDYLYDFGDGNEIAITNLGAVSGFDVADFASVGPDLVLKRCDLLRKRRLGDMQALRRPGEAAFSATMSLACFLVATNRIFLPDLAIPLSTSAASSILATVLLRSII